MSHLTNAQLVALKAHINADNALKAILQAHTPPTPDDYQSVSNAMNLTASPDWWVWRTSVSKEEFTNTTSVDNTTFSWSTYISRSQGERDGWRELFSISGAVNPALTNVRQAIADIFSGAGGAANRTHLLTIARRLATRAEKLFCVTQVSVGTTAAPATMTHEGLLDGDHIKEAWELA